MVVAMAFATVSNGCTVLPGSILDVFLHDTDSFVQAPQPPPHHPPVNRTAATQYPISRTRYVRLATHHAASGGRSWVTQSVLRSGRLQPATGSRGRHQLQAGAVAYRDPTLASGGTTRVYTRVCGH